MKKPFIWIGLFTFLVACNKGQNPTIEELRQQEIERRVRQYLENKKDECYNLTMDKAIAQADSLLKLNAVIYREDSLRRPELPIKPELQVRPTPHDTILPRPFFKTDTVQE